MPIELDIEQLREIKGTTDSYRFAREFIRKFAEDHLHERALDELASYLDNPTNPGRPEILSAIADAHLDLEHMGLLGVVTACFGSDDKNLRYCATHALCYGGAAARKFLRIELERPDNKELKKLVALIS